MKLKTCFNICTVFAVSMFTLSLFVNHDYYWYVYLSGFLGIAGQAICNSIKIKRNKTNKNNEAV